MRMGDYSLHTGFGQGVIRTRSLGDANESHRAYFATKWQFGNVTNLSHAIAYSMSPLSFFWLE